MEALTEQLKRAAIVLWLVCRLEDRINHSIGRLHLLRFGADIGDMDEECEAGVTLFTRLDNFVDGLGNDLQTLRRVRPDRSE